MLQLWITCDSSRQQGIYPALKLCGALSLVQIEVMAVLSSISMHRSDGEDNGQAITRIPADTILAQAVLALQASIAQC